MKLSAFIIKDIVFIAILSAALTLSGLITMPLVMSVTLFGVRNMASALLYSLFVMIGIMKVKKPGTLTLIGFLHGAVLLMMAPVMFWSMFIGAFLTECITLLIFRSYDKSIARLVGASLFIPMTIPMTLVFTMAIHGKTAPEILGSPLTALILTLATIALSFIGAKLGEKIGTELQKAGKL